MASTKSSASAHITKDPNTRAGDPFLAAAKRPENLTREQKGLDLYRCRRGAFERITRDVFLVPSCTGRGEYRVDLVAGMCSCRDFERRHDTCKHLVAAELYRSWLRKAARTIAAVLDADDAEGEQ